MSDPRLYVPFELDDAGLSCTAFRLLATLTRRQGTNSAGFPSTTTLARTCCVSKRSVIIYLKELVKRGAIRPLHRPGQSGRFEIVPIVEWIGNRCKPCTSKHPTGAESAPVPSGNRCRIRTEPVQNLHSTGAESAQRRYTKKVHKEERARSPRAGGFSPLSAELPFTSNSFAEVWRKWCDHRREKKKPMTPTATSEQLAELAGMGEPRAIAALKHSTKNGYTGIFEPSPSRVEKPKRKNY